MSATEAHLDGSELIATQCLTAPVDVVWSTFTTPAHVAAFWGGDHATVPAESVRVDLRVGGGFELETRAVGSGEPGRRLVFRYERIEAPRLLVFSEPASGIRTIVTLEPEGGRTTVTIRQQKLPPELRTEQARIGLAGILDALADLLARHLGDAGSR